MYKKQSLNQTHFLATCELTTVRIEAFTQPVLVINSEPTGTYTTVEFKLSCSRKSSQNDSRLCRRTEHLAG
jgi:hypothetical protein